MSERKSVCFVSDENRCRSIIAEVILRHLAREQFAVQSFGLRPGRVHFLVQEALKRKGYDPDYSFSKAYEVVENQKFDIQVLLHPDLKNSLPRVPYSYESVTWAVPPVALDGETADSDTLAQLTAVCEDIEKQVRSFISAHSG